MAVNRDIYAWLVSSSHDIYVKCHNNYITPKL